MTETNLPEGTFVVGNGLYATCRICGKLVKLNKRFFGSFHVCALSEEESELQAGVSPMNHRLSNKES